MSGRALLWTVWAASLLTVPIPFFLVETGAVPVARLAQLTAATLALIVAEGANGAAGIGAALLGAQAVLASLLLFAASWLLVRTTTSLDDRARAGLAALVLIALLAASLLDIYSTPFRTRALRGNIVEVFE